MPPVLIPANRPSLTRKDGHYTIYAHPRISANQLALYMASTPAQQEIIVRNARRVAKVIVANYDYARHAVTRCHTEIGLDEGRMRAQIDRLQRTPGRDNFDRKNLEISRRALTRMLPMLETLECPGVLTPRPSIGFSHVAIEGVRVSIQPDLVYSFESRGILRHGGIITTFAQTPQSALTRTIGGSYAGDYAAYLVYLFLSLNFAGNGAPQARNCYAVDIYRDTIWQSPTSQQRMLGNVEAACRAIGRYWLELELEGE